jgi:hypothetical protein
MAGHDSFEFAPDSGPAGAAGSPSWANTKQSSNSAVSNIHAALAGAHEDAFGSSIIPDAMHATQQWAHHSDFHFI